MAFRLVSSGGATVDPTVVNVAASGTVWPGSLVDSFGFTRTGGALVAASTETSTGTMVFGVCLDYVQGASDTSVRVIPINSSQIWEVDCVNSASTAQIGLRHALSALAANKSRFIHNTATDVSTGVSQFLALAMTGLTTGSGKLLGRFIHYTGQVIPVNSTVFLQ